MSKKTLRAVVVAVSLVFLFAAGSFAFTQSEGGIKEYSGVVSYRYNGGFFLKTASGEETTGKDTSGVEFIMPP